MCNDRDKDKEVYQKFALPVSPIAPKQIFLPHGKNIPWINIKTGKVVYILSVGENCFVSENVTIGNNVTLMNLITIKGGCTLGIIYPNDQKNQPINFSAKTVIHDGVTVFAD